MPDISVVQCKLFTLKGDEVIQPGRSIKSQEMQGKHVIRRQKSKGEFMKSSRFPGNSEGAGKYELHGV